MVSLQTEIAGVKLDNCIYNASGARCTSGQELEYLALSKAGAVLTKSCTTFYREGNAQPRYWSDFSYYDECPWNISINSTGLHNMGYRYYVDYGETLNKLNNTQNNKPYIMSVAGLNCQEKVDILKRIAQSEKRQYISAIELNISCPNLKESETSGQQLGQLDLLDSIYEFWGEDCPIPIGLKLPPYFDLKHIEEVADVIKKYPIGFVTCVNSLGNGLVIDLETESPVIKPRGGHGGIGGSPILPIALSNVRHFYKSLPEHISVIGCGGVQSGKEAFMHILAGASAVQIGTQLMLEGPSCFERVSKELEELMTKKGYKSIQDFKGKLNT